MRDPRHPYPSERERADRRWRYVGTSFNYAIGTVMGTLLASWWAPVGAAAVLATYLFLAVRADLQNR